MRTVNRAPPATDSAANVATSDVVGSKLDRSYVSGDSLYALVATLEDHIHGVTKVYPTEAAGVTLTSDAGGAWNAQGALAQVMPASTAGGVFDVHFITVEDMDTNGVYEIVLYSGAGDTEIARFRVGRTNNFTTQAQIPILTPLIADADRIRASCAHSVGGSATCTISISYHVY
jgi:hypothetical protein